MNSGLNSIGDRIMIFIFLLFPLSSLLFLL
jgi:hypothetical protein